MKRNEHTDGEKRTSIEPAYQFEKVYNRAIDSLIDYVSAGENVLKAVQEAVEYINGMCGDNWDKGLVLDKMKNGLGRIGKYIDYSVLEAVVNTPKQSVEELLSGKSEKFSEAYNAALKSAVKSLSTTEDFLKGVQQVVDYLQEYLGGNWDKDSVIKMLSDGATKRNYDYNQDELKRIVYSHSPNVNSSFVTPKQLSEKGQIGNVPVSPFPTAQEHSNDKNAANMKISRREITILIILGLYLILFYSTRYVIKVETIVELTNPASVYDGLGGDTDTITSYDTTTYTWSEYKTITSFNENSNKGIGERSDLIKGKNIHLFFLSLKDVTGNQVMVYSFFKAIAFMCWGILVVLALKVAFGFIAVGRLKEFFKGG